MAKQLKDNKLGILPVPREAIAAVGGEGYFVEIYFRLFGKRNQNR